MQFIQNIIAYIKAIFNFVKEILATLGVNTDDMTLPF